MSQTKVITVGLEKGETGGEWFGERSGSTLTMTQWTMQNQWR